MILSKWNQDICYVHVVGCYGSQLATATSSVSCQLLFRVDDKSSVKP